MSTGAQSSVVRSSLPPIGFGLVPARLDDEFVRLYDAMASDMLQVRREMDALPEGGAELDERLEREVAPVARRYLAALDDLAGIADHFDAAQASEHRRYVVASRFYEALGDVPYYRQIQTRPRGYVGDAETMRFIYAQSFEGDSPFARLFHRIATDVRACAAVRNRRDYLRSAIESRRYRRVLDVGAGPAEEVRLALGDASLDVQVLAIDHDVQTYRELAAAIHDPRFSVAIANALDLASGRRWVATPRRDGAPKCFPRRDFRWPRALLAPAKYRIRALRPRSFELIVCAGLFDYLRTFESATKGTLGLTRTLFDLLAPGGELIIGNFSTDMPRGQRFCMEYLCDWWLAYRTPRELQELTRALPGGTFTAHVEAEPEGLNLFLHVIRRR